jgi:hypothetical protein
VELALVNEALGRAQDALAQEDAAAGEAALGAELSTTRTQVLLTSHLRPTGGGGSRPVY